MWDLTIYVLTVHLLNIIMSSSACLFVYLCVWMVGELTGGFQAHILVLLYFFSQINQWWETTTQFSARCLSITPTTLTWYLSMVLIDQPTPLSPVNQTKVPPSAWSLLFEWQALVAWDVFRFWPITMWITSEVQPLTSTFSFSLTGIHHYQQQFHLRTFTGVIAGATCEKTFHQPACLFTCIHYIHLHHPTEMKRTYIFTSMFIESCPLFSQQAHGRSDQRNDRDEILLHLTGQDWI